MTRSVANCSPPPPTWRGIQRGIGSKRAKPCKTAHFGEQISNQFHSRNVSRLPASQGHLLLDREASHAWQSQVASPPRPVWGLDDSEAGLRVAATPCVLHDAVDGPPTDSNRLTKEDLSRNNGVAVASQFRLRGRVTKWLLPAVPLYWGSVV